MQLKSAAAPPNKAVFSFMASRHSGAGRDLHRADAPLLFDEVTCVRRISTEDAPAMLRTGDSLEKSPGDRGTKLLWR
jgi:hypothetical protein